MAEGAVRYGTPLAEVPWRHGRHRLEQVYAQHGPLADDGDPWVLMAASEALAGYVVRLHNAQVTAARRRQDQA